MIEPLLSLLSLCDDPIDVNGLKQLLTQSNDTHERKAQTTEEKDIQTYL